MSADELERFNQATEIIERLGGMFKWAIGSAFTVCACVAGIAVWVHTTDAQAQQTREDLHSLMIDRAQNMRELASWRVIKDDIDARLTVIVENQQREIDRIERGQGR